MQPLTHYEREIEMWGRPGGAVGSTPASQQDGDRLVAMGVQGIFLPLAWISVRTSAMVLQSLQNWSACQHVWCVRRTHVGVFFMSIVCMWSLLWVSGIDYADMSQHVPTHITIHVVHYAFVCVYMKETMTRPLFPGVKRTFRPRHNSLNTSNSLLIFYYFKAVLWALKAF